MGPVAQHTTSVLFHSHWMRPALYPCIQCETGFNHVLPISFLCCETGFTRDASRVVSLDVKCRQGRNDRRVPCRSESGLTGFQRSPQHVASRWGILLTLYKARSA